MKFVLYARISKPPIDYKQRPGESEQEYQKRLDWIKKFVKEQNPLNQLLPLREWAKNAVFDGKKVEVYKEMVDEISSRDTRPKKEQILKWLRTGVIQGVAFVRLDRWGRTTSELVAEFEEATKKAWTFVSLKEGFSLDTAEGRLHARLLAVFAEFERDRIRDRTMEGLFRARAQGKKLGRPRKTPPVNPGNISGEKAKS